MDPYDMLAISNRAGQTIQGFGTAAYQNTAIYNNGTISANTSGHVLSLKIPNQAETVEPETPQLSEPVVEPFAF